MSERFEFYFDPEKLYLDQRTAKIDEILKEIAVVQEHISALYQLTAKLLQDSEDHFLDDDLTNQRIEKLEIRLKEATR